MTGFRSTARAEVWALSMLGGLGDVGSSWTAGEGWPPQQGDKTCCPRGMYLYPGEGLRTPMSPRRLRT